MPPQIGTAAPRAPYAMRALFQQSLSKTCTRRTQNAGATTAALCAHELRGPLETFRRLYTDVRLSLLDGPAAETRRLF